MQSGVVTGRFCQTMNQWPNHALQRTRPSHHCCNRGVPWAGSLSLGRWPVESGVGLR
jgi:hypothetical protein